MTVLNISREKTAIIIPNAVGILTPQDKVGWTLIPRFSLTVTPGIKVDDFSLSTNFHEILHTIL